jgi:hypothetical protein
MVLKYRDIPLISSLTVFLFGLLLVLRHLLFFGFAPMVSHRPEVIKKILDEINPEPDTVFYSLGYGRSGFLDIARQRCPKGEFIGVDEGFVSACLSRLQLFLRKINIKVLCCDYYKADLRRAQVVYCYLNPEELRDLYKKLKLEPRTDAIIISAGFVVPYLDPIKVIKTEQKKKWYGFLTSHKKVLTIKEREHTRDDNIYFYQV